MYIFITYCITQFLTKDQAERFFFITGKNFTEEHIEEQDLGGSKWENKKRKKEGGETLNTDTEIYNNKKWLGLLLTVDGAYSLFTASEGKKQKARRRVCVFVCVRVWMCVSVAL